MNHTFEKIISTINNLLSSTLFAQENAGKKGLLQKFDPRIKVISIFILLVTVGWLKNLVVLVILNIVAFAIALLSKIPPFFFLKRVYIFLPFFTLIIAIPVIFNFISPGPMVLTLIEIPQLKFLLGITYPGLFTAIFLILRVSVSISFVMLLVLTTRWNEILKTLQVLYIPPIITIILGMTYRYIFVLLKSTDNLILARKSRLVGKLSGELERKILISSLGALFSRSFFLSEEIYLSMQSRGYREKVHTLDNYEK